MLVSEYVRSGHSHASLFFINDTTSNFQISGSQVTSYTPSLHFDESNYLSISETFGDLYSAIENRPDTIDLSDRDSIIDEYAGCIKIGRDITLEEILEIREDFHGNNC